MKRPHGFSNPGGFDYEGWLFQQRIRAMGYVSRKTGNTRLREGDAWYLHRLRYFMREKLMQELHGEVNGGLIPALMVGDRSAIEKRQWQVLTSTGTSHLLAISGLHIGLCRNGRIFRAHTAGPYHVAGIAHKHTPFAEADNFVNYCAGLVLCACF